MHKVVVLYPAPKDAQAFKEHYERTHLPLVAKLPGLRDYRYSFDVTGFGPGDSPYFAIFEGDFDDAEAMAAAFASPEGKAVQADVPNYATGGAVVLNYPVREP
jgi:uncharacterized protein (TIGR02118 family)